MTTPYILDIQNVTKDYAQHRALDNVSIQIPKGSIYGLLGPNGAGKTSLIRIINQITAPDSGHVLFNGELLNPSHISKIGYLPEERGLYKKMKVGEQLLYLARLKGISKAESLRKIKEWLVNFQLENWWDKEINSLSKGMQQKVQFISTIIHEPELIILDEPFSGFDPINANLVKDEILKLRDQGATVIFSTHRMESVEELCDYICLINQSQKILEGPLQEVKKQHQTHQYRVIIDTPNNDWKHPEMEILEQKNVLDKRTEIVLKLSANISQTQAFSFFAEKGKIESFAEVIPSASEIFIKTVNAETHG